MRQGLTYSRKFLVASYRQKARELGRPPTLKEINADKGMASYWTYYRQLGLKENICSSLKIANIPATIYHLFCADCIHDSSTCQENPFDCAREAELYFTS